MSVTIYEIAERAGVSSSTVARILRGDVRESHRRSAATAQRIRQLATEMGYRPNLRARAFSRGRTHGIGLLYTDDAWIFEGVNTEVVNSLVRSLQREGYHLVFCPVDESGSWEEIVLGGQIDGGVVFQTLPAEVAEAVRERQLPLVLLGDDSDPGMSQVVVDDFAGAYAATKHLLGLGHRRVMMFVHESVKPHCSVEERLSGYRTAMDEAGLMAQECLRVSEGEAVDMLVRGDEPADRRRLLQRPGIDALGPCVVAIWRGDSGRRQPGRLQRRVRHALHDAAAHDGRASTPRRSANWARSWCSRKSAPPTASGKPTVMTVKPTLIVRGSTGPLRSREATPIRRTESRKTIER